MDVFKLLFTFVLFIMLLCDEGLLEMCNVFKLVELGIVLMRKLLWDVLRDERLLFELYARLLLFVMCVLFCEELLMLLCDDLWCMLYEKLSRNKE